MSTNAEGEMRNKGKNTEGEITTGSERLHCIDEHVTGSTRDQVCSQTHALKNMNTFVINKRRTSLYITCIDGHVTGIT